MPRNDAVRLIRFASVLWLVYLVALVVINQSLGPPRGRSEPFYYIFHGFIALLCLGLSYWSWIQGRLRQAFVPLVIGIIVTLPVAANYLIMRLLPFGPQFAPGDPA